MNISTRLKLAALVPALMALIITLALVSSYRVVQEAQEKDRIVQEVMTSTGELNSSIVAYVLYREDQAKEEFLTEHDSITDLISTTRLNNPAQQQLLRHLGQDGEAIRTSFLNLVSTYEGPDPDLSAGALRGVQQRLTGELLARSRDWSLDSQLLETLVDEEIATTQMRISALVILITVAAAVSLTFVLVLTIRRITTSLAVLRKGTEVVGAGNLAHRIGMSARDELGQFARSFDRMTERLQAVTVSRQELQQEIEERKQAEESLRQQESRYHSTLDGMLEGCAIIGYDWRYLYLNDAVARPGRQTKEALLGHTIMELYPGIEHTELFAQLQSCMVDRTSHHLETEFAYPHGSFRWLELSITPVKEGIFVLSLDITERKRAQQLKDEFIGMVSHELRTPLTVMIGGLHTLLNYGSQGGKRAY